jgi:hypothetical protein
MEMKIVLINIGRTKVDRHRVRVIQIGYQFCEPSGDSPRCSFVYWESPLEIQWGCPKLKIQALLKFFF